MVSVEGELFSTLKNKQEIVRNVSCDSAEEFYIMSFVTEAKNGFNTKWH